MSDEHDPSTPADSPSITSSRKRSQPTEDDSPFRPQRDIEARYEKGAKLLDRLLAARLEGDTTDTPPPRPNRRSFATPRELNYAGSKRHRSKSPLPSSVRTPPSTTSRRSKRQKGKQRVNYSELSDYSDPSDQDDDVDMSQPPLPSLSPGQGQLCRQQGRRGPPDPPGAGGMSPEDMQHLPEGT